MGTLTVLDWPALLAIPDTRWYLDCTTWDGDGRCAWQNDCGDPFVAWVEYEVAGLPGDPYGFDSHETDVVCSHHLPDLITHVTEEPLVAGTVVEVGVDPALLRLTGVDPAVVARFNDGALGVAA